MTRPTRAAAGARAARMPKDQRRAQLLDAANTVFTLRGYHAAAMDDIAEAAGVSKPVLYQHFSSKLDLYLALLDRSCERLVEIVADALASTENNADRVIAAVGAFYDFVSSASGEFRFVFESDLTGDNTVQKRLWRVNDEIADAIAEVIAEDTALPAAESKLLAISLVGIAQVSARYWVSRTARRSRSTTPSGWSAAVWRGLEPAADRSRTGGPRRGQSVGWSTGSRAATGDSASRRSRPELASCTGGARPPTAGIRDRILVAGDRLRCGCDRLSRAAAWWLRS